MRRRAICIVVLACLWVVEVRAEAPPKEVLVLYSFGREFAPFNIMAGSFRTELARQSPEPIEFHEAALETARLRQGANELPLVDYLQALVATHQLDLIVTLGGPATLFVDRHREQLFPHVPVIATMDQRRVEESVASNNMTVVPLRLNLPGLIEDILQTLPATTNVVVVAGATPFEQYWADEFKHDFAPFTNRIAFTYLNSLSLERMCQEVRALPPDSAILHGALVMDAAGVPHEREAGLMALHASANAPIFGVFEHQLGLGIVGGRLTSNEAWGRRVAGAALRVLNGEPIAQIESEPTAPGPPIYDWRELQRWNIDLDRLPSNARILFREPTLWEQHKWLILGGTALCLFEAVLIASLILELRRRHQAEALARQQRAELAHASRLATVGELTASLAHELNQPLAAILSAAQAGLRFMSAERSDPAEIRDILQNIVQDNKRAAAVVSGLRTMLRRQTSQRERVDLAGAVQEILNMLHTEFLTNHVNVSVRCQPDCDVFADKTQIQQVVLNLVMNSIEAMRSLGVDQRHIEVVSAREATDRVKVAVSDTGPGIPSEDTAKLFDSFWTTKSQGMGIGLAICRSILESHGGRIWLDHSQPGKTTFCFSLPLSPKP